MLIWGEAVLLGAEDALDLALLTPGESLGTFRLLC